MHLAGIGGVGMAALAVLLKRRGHEVDGCDLGATDRTRWLESLGIPVHVGHSPSHVVDSDLVIATPAVDCANPELLAATKVVRRGEMLAKIVDEARDSIAVSGSHGKTTTATFIAKLLLALGEKVEWAIGGETGAFPVAGCRGEGVGDGVLIVEADESDGTLALYHPGMLVVTNCEYDHPDHFPTPADYFACFEKAKANAGVVISGRGTNEETAVEVALRRGHSREAVERALPAVTAELPDRRFQRIAEGVYTDYGHHPTEIRYSLERFRSLARGKLRVLFQPHRYSRTAALKEDFARAFSAADEVILCPTYAAFEKPVKGGDTADLLAAMTALGTATPAVSLALSCEEAWKRARELMRPGDITVLQGAGDIIALVSSIRT